MIRKWGRDLEAGTDTNLLSEIGWSLYSFLLAILSTPG